MDSPERNGVRKGCLLLIRRRTEVWYLLACAWSEFGLGSHPLINQIGKATLSYQIGGNPYDKKDWLNKQAIKALLDGGGSELREGGGYN